MKRYFYQFIASLPLGSSSVLIVHAKAMCKRGDLRSSLLSELSLLAKEAGINDACIQVSKLGTSRYKLKFFGVPASLQQRVRNVWEANR